MEDTQTIEATPISKDMQTLVDSIRNEVNQNIAKRTKATGIANTSVPTIKAYPDALPSTEAKNIGIIVDDQYSVEKLLMVGKVVPPDGLHWLQLKSYDAFKDFLEKRGIPAYVSFDGVIEPSKSGKYEGYDCAKLLIEKCKALNIELPTNNCHSPAVSTKQKIDLLLLDYTPKKDKVKQA